MMKFFFNEENIEKKISIMQIQFKYIICIVTILFMSIFDYLNELDFN